MDERKTYFILPTSDFDTTNIKLGQIITNIRLPYRPLSPPLNTAEAPLPEVHTRLRENYTFYHSKALSGAIGIQAQFLAQLGSPLGADAEVSRERGDVSKWVIDRLETAFIEPSQEYVEASVMQVPKVKNWLQERRLTGKVYMVTGIKIASGVKYFNTKARKMGLGGAATVDLTAFTGAPVAVGPKGDLEKKLDTAESYTTCSDFVWAYRMQKVYVRWLGGGVKSKEMVGGILAGVEEEYEEEEMETYSDEEEEEEGEPPEIGGVILEPDEGWDMVPNGFVKAEENTHTDDEEEGDAFVYPEL